MTPISLGVKNCIFFKPHLIAIEKKQEKKKIHKKIQAHL